MMGKAFDYAKNMVLYTEHVDNLKKCRNDVSRLEKEVAALKAFQRIVEGAIEVRFKEGK